jgi:hypothetical protein
MRASAVMRSQACYRRRYEKKRVLIYLSYDLLARHDKIIISLFFSMYGMTILNIFMLPLLFCKILVY